MRIVIADPLPISAADLLSTEGWTVDAENGRSPETLALALADADALIVRSATRVDAELLSAFAQATDLDATDPADTITAQRLRLPAAMRGGGLRSRTWLVWWHP